MKFADVPMLTSCGSYEVNVPLDYLDEHITRYQQVERGSAPLNLLPDFQRGHVWLPTQQTAYVEFFLRGGMTGRTIYMNCPNWGHFNAIKPGMYNEFVIVDGLQRLTALLKFVRGELPAFGHYVCVSNAQLAPGVQCGPLFEDRLRMSDAGSNLRINVNNLKTRSAVLQWYLEMNEGGTPHTKLELDKVRDMLRCELKG